MITCQMLRCWVPVFGRVLSALAFAAGSGPAAWVATACPCRAGSAFVASAVDWAGVAELVAGWSVVEAGAEAGALESGVTDAGVEAGALDSGVNEAGVEAGALESGVVDAGVSGAELAGTSEVGVAGCSAAELAEDVGGTTGISGVALVDEVGSVDFAGVEVADELDVAGVLEAEFSDEAGGAGVTGCSGSSGVVCGFVGVLE